MKDGENQKILKQNCEETKIVRILERYWSWYLAV